MSKFRCWSVMAVAAITLSTMLSTSAVVQYNSQTNQLVTNVRMNWIYSALSDVFPLSTERRNLDSGIVLDRLVTAKVTKLLAF